MTDRPVRNVSCDSVFTFEDATDRLGIAMQARCSVRDDNILRLAVSNAYRDLPTAHEWSYYKRTYQFASSASEAFTGFTYNATTKIGTIVSPDAWPTDAEEGLVIIGDNVYAVEERIDDQNIRFQSTNAPAAGVDGVTWCRAAYPIPCIQTVTSVLESPTDFVLTWRPHEDISDHLRVTPFPSQPIAYCIRGLGMHLSRMHIEFAPPPQTSRDYIIAGNFRPRDIVIHAEPFVVTTSGTTVTPDPTGTVSFEDRHVGSILRFSSTTGAPTGRYGRDGEYNPYVAQRVITAVSGGNATIDSSLSSELSGVAAVVSDPLDLDTETMLNYFDALAARKLSEMTLASPDRADFIQLERTALRAAISADRRVNTRSGRNIWSGPYDFASTLKFPVSGE